MAQEKRTLVDEVLDDVLQVRETALANAKLALEEAFEPRIKSMISRHLQNETELDDVELEERGDEDMEERMEDDELEERGDEDEMEERSMMNAGDEDGIYDDPTNSDDASMSEEEHEDEMDEMDSEDSEVEEGDYSDEEMEEEMEDEDDLDLESVIAELEAELSDEEDEDEGEMDFEDEGEADMDDMSMDADEEEEDDDEIIDLDELLTALTEEDDEEEVEEVVEENSELEQENERLASELAEHREAVEILRSKLNEVNLLNAKLLYTTKLFRKFNLSNDQKMKVVESFDRTSSVRETKLVFSTLAESLSMNNSSKTKKKVASITEGFASKPTQSTKPKQQEIISEGNEVADRFRRLVSYNK